MNINNQPLVTVYIPTYNRVELLKRAVQSVQKQTYKNLEIIIVDDCSTDGTHDYLKLLKKEDKRVRYFLKEKNSGACVSRNIAIEHASGEFITGLDDDDYFLENRIYNFYNAYKMKDDNIVALFTPNIKSKSRSLFKNKLLHLISKKVVKKRDLYGANYIGNQIFAKKAIFIEAGMFDPSFRAWQDFDLWFRISKIGNFQRLSEPTYIFDTTHGEVRITTSNIDKIIEVRDLFIKKHNIVNDFYRVVLNNHLFIYNPKLVSFRSIFYKFILHYSDPKNNLSYLLRFIKSRIMVKR